MKKRLQPNARQRTDARHAVGLGLRRRRLSFEQFEQRLTLSGSPVVGDAPTADGGFLVFDVGDFLSTSTIDFSEDSLGPFDFDLGPVLDVTIQTQSPIGNVVMQRDQITTSAAGVTSAFANFTLNREEEFSVNFDGGERHSLTIPDAPVNSSSDLSNDSDDDSDGLVDADATLVPTGVAGRGVLVTDVAAGQESLLTPDDSVDKSNPTSDTSDLSDEGNKTEQTSVSVEEGLAEISTEVTADPLEQLVRWPSSKRSDSIYLPHEETADELAESSEGGPIKVTQAVVEAQRAYETKVFAAVAAQLDEQDFLAQPAPPVEQPLSAELARSMAFESLELEPSSDPARLNDSSAPSAMLPPTSFDEDPLASKPAMDEEPTDDEPADALAFAQWPLLYSATVGAVLVGTRRRTRTGTAQLPPRRNRQTNAS